MMSFEDHVPVLFAASPFGGCVSQEVEQNHHLRLSNLVLDFASKAVADAFGVGRLLERPRPALSNPTSSPAPFELHDGQGL